ncbi:MAG: hypothetical protein IKG42_00005 [Clostridia bacterium]|nr:hypothetical protein [Clostridia bacterium]
MTLRRKPEKNETLETRTQQRERKHRECANQYLYGICKNALNKGNGYISVKPVRLSDGNLLNTTDIKNFSEEYDVRYIPECGLDKKYPVLSFTNSEKIKK